MGTSPDLRILYNEPKDHAAPTADVTIKASDLFAALEIAIRDRRRWLDDFADDPVKITRDMYETLLAYKRLRSEQAA
jgi:hypothetical protein